MKIEALLTEGRRVLQRQGTFSVALDVRLLLQAAAGLSHEEIIAHPAQDISREAESIFYASIARRSAHEPVSRILGRREFYGREYIITPDVLDPRPDTEVVVELALTHVKHGRFVDLGTGSGAIAITLCGEADQLIGIATDVSAAALQVARTNAQRLGVSDRLSFHKNTWFVGLTGAFDLIISNPPYIATHETLSPDVANYDPHIALFAGEDGLLAYREIARQASAHLSGHGVVIVEIGAGQITAVKSLFESHGLKLFDQAMDLAGHARALAFKNP